MTTHLFTVSFTTSSKRKIALMFGQEDSKSQTLVLSNLS